MVCDSGNQSQKAVAEVQKLGFIEVASLEGGVQGWQAAALPLVK
jgi:rhodanese-related sulfurtransferase